MGRNDPKTLPERTISHFPGLDLRVQLGFQNPFFSICGFIDDFIVQI